ncbi:MAG: YajD family HNH nuclease [Nitrospinota bacterium]
MSGRGFRKSRRGKGPFKTDIQAESVRDFVRDIKAKKSSSYRERSLALHGWICAKCGREFDASNLHLLTVHHKDGDPGNNPPDGSNWENLCVDCHEDEHSRGLLGDYLTKDS